MMMHSAWKVSDLRIFMSSYLPPLFTLPHPSLHSFCVPLYVRVCVCVCQREIERGVGGLRKA